MQKPSFKKYDFQQFTFTHSLKMTPDSSNNISFLNGLRTNKKTIVSESINLTKQRNYPQLFQINKQNYGEMRMSVNDRSKNKNNSIIKSGSHTKQKKPLEDSSNHKKSVSYNIKINLSRHAVKQNKLLLTTPNIITSSLKKLQFHSTKQENIKVYIRLKPKKQTEVGREFLQIINNKTAKIQDNYYCFDEIFNSGVSQEGIFNCVGKQICNRLFEGYNGTIFAYGQTGSGKTYTIFGENTQRKSEGLIYRCMNHILNKRKQLKSNVKIKCSMVELYKEDLIDMFAGQRELKLKESKSCGVYIEGLRQVYINNEQQIMGLVKQASKNRKVTATKINQQSSRSHTLLNVYIQTQKFTAKLCLIDLAGSEKVRKSEAKGDSFEETKKINYSLSCLGNVINALTTRNKSQHIPFRDSKLTRILKDSLTGNFLTSIIVNCSINYNSVHQTVSSLKFAERAKKIKVNIHSLEQQSQSQTNSIKQLHSIIKKLQYDLELTTQQLKRYKQSENNKNTHNMDWQHYTQESQLSVRNPIPSERANVQQNIKKYRKGNYPPIEPKPYGGNIHDFSSLNVSKSMRRFQDSPGMSSLSYKQDESPDLSLSFSIHGQSAQRKLLFN